MGIAPNPDDVSHNVEIKDYNDWMDYSSLLQLMDLRNAQEAGLVTHQICTVCNLDVSNVEDRNC